NCTQSVALFCGNQLHNLSQFIVLVGRMSVGTIATFLRRMAFTCRKLSALSASARGSSPLLIQIASETGPILAFCDSADCIHGVIQRHIFCCEYLCELIPHPPKKYNSWERNTLMKTDVYYEEEVGT